VNIEEIVKQGEPVNDKWILGLVAIWAIVIGTCYLIRVFL
jgi:hypothetical protein